MCECWSDRKLMTRNESVCTRHRKVAVWTEFLREFESEQMCWDPKDGELYLSRMKPEEILVEVRRGSDVQIDLLT